MKCVGIALCLCLAGGLVKAQEIIPAPLKLVKSQGVFTLGPRTRILATGEAMPIADGLRNALRPATGLDLPLTGNASNDEIQLVLDSKISDLGDEGYRLTVNPDRVEIRAPKPAGLFYGTQSLRQLLPPSIFREACVSGVAWTIPVVTVEDKPRFVWRGCLLDVSRHFMPKSFIKKHLDMMALHKLNVFHWHLTDDQGWRLEIKKYPRLTQVGAWRSETILPFFDTDRPDQARYDNTPHGGFYSQEDAREIVKYAAARFITVVPEIEMPGHSCAAIAAYPELGNFPDKKVEVGRRWGVYQSTYSPEDRTIAFLKDVLDEVMGIFPSTYIHVGGDECPKREWAHSERALMRMKQEGYVDANTTLEDLQKLPLDHNGRHGGHPALQKLQGWFIRQAGAHLASKGRRLIGWEEILQGGQDPSVSVVNWLGEKGGIAAAKSGHDVVMGEHFRTYLDYYQSPAPEFEPLGAMDTCLTLEKAYTYEPVPTALTESEAKHIIGVQASIWTELIATPQHVEYMAWPRLAALSEVFWSPKGPKDFTDFTKRLSIHAKRLETLGVQYRPLTK